jgi:hypothetical protein
MNNHETEHNQNAHYTQTYSPERYECTPVKADKSVYIYSTKRFMAADMRLRAKDTEGSACVCGERRHLSRRKRCANLELLVYEALSYSCMRPYATSV